MSLGARFFLSLFIFIIGFESSVNTAFAIEKASLYQFNFQMGPELFTYSETHPYQPTLGVNHYQQTSLVGRVEGKLWIIPRFAQLLASADATLFSIKNNDSGKPIQLYAIRGGMNFNCGTFDDIQIGCAAGVLSMTMETTGRAWGFQYLRGPWIRASVTYDLQSDTSSPETLSFLPQINFLGTTWIGPLDFGNKEISLGLQFRDPLAQGKFPTFIFDKAILFSLYFDFMSYTFSDIRTVTVSDSRVRFLIGYEF